MEYDDIWGGQISRVHKVKSTGQLDETVDYVWDGDRLAASEYTDYKDDGTGNYIVDDVVPVRYLYDADGEPMGFSVTNQSGDGSAIDFRPFSPFNQGTVP